MSDILIHATEGKRFVTGRRSQVGHRSQVNLTCDLRRVTCDKIDNLINIETTPPSSIPHHTTAFLSVSKLKSPSSHTR